jgi:hypothetical protein
LHDLVSSFVPLTTDPTAANGLTTFYVNASSQITHPRREIAARASGTLPHKYQQE